MWTEFRKKPIQIGKCSRGFLVPKDNIKLDSSKTYVIRIIEEDHHPGQQEEVDTNALTSNAIRTSIKQPTGQQATTEIYKRPLCDVDDTGRVCKLPKPVPGVGCRN